MRKLKNFPLTIIIVSLLLLTSTLAAWYITKSVTERETLRLFNDEVNVIESWISNRLESYKTIAYGLQGFWAGSEVVTQEEWQTYAKTLKISERFPGITSVNFVRRVDDNYIITFVYPSEREAAVGTNVFNLPGRREAIEKALASGSVAITDKVLLVADQSPGFVMFAPLYQKGLPINTVEERRVAIEGLVTLAFRSEQVFKDLFDAHDTFPYLDFELYKGKVLEEDHILYDHDYALYIPKGDPRKRLETKRTIILDGETFTLLVASKPSFGLRTLEKQLPNIVLVSGFVFNLLIFIFAFSGFWRLQKLQKKLT